MSPSTTIPTPTTPTTTTTTVNSTSFSLSSPPPYYDNDLSYITIPYEPSPTFSSQSHYPLIPSTIESESEERELLDFLKEDNLLRESEELIWSQEKVSMKLALEMNYPSTTFKPYSPPLPLLLLSKEKAWESTSKMERNTSIFCCTIS